MNEQNNRNETITTAIADLEAPSAEEIKGGMLDQGRVRISTSSGVNASATTTSRNGNLQIADLTGVV